MTTVYKIHPNGEVDELTFSLPPSHALICAYEQDRGNNNTWTYDFNSPQYTFKKGKYGLMLENFWTKYQHDPTIMAAFVALQNE